MAISALLADPQKLLYLAVVFWIFVAAVVWAGLWYARSRNREKQKTIRMAIEKGVKLDPALIESIDRDRPARPEDYSIGGYICTATGIGLFPLGFFLRFVAVEAFYPLMGAGILVVLVGLSLLLVARMIQSRNDRGNGFRAG